MVARYWLGRDNPQVAFCVNVLDIKAYLNIAAEVAMSHEEGVQAGLNSSHR